MDAPVAPDLDEIIGDSDEENGVVTEVVTPAELLKKLDHTWRNEKGAPELLSAQTELLGLVQEEVGRLESEAKLLPPGDLRAQLKLMEAERIRFVLTDYMRIRIGKIEQFAHHILSEERARPSDESPHLTAEEFLFAKSYTNSIKEYLKNTIVNRLPANMQSIKEEELAFHPNPNAYVFCRALTRVNSVEVPDHIGGDSQTRTTTIDMEPGEQHLLPFSCIRSLVQDGKVLLI